VHGFKIEETMTDNGSEFTAYTSQKAKKTHFFETMLDIFEIKHRYTLPYRPQANGKIDPPEADGRYYMMSVQGYKLLLFQRRIL
jgi:transposase InsO family protein